MNKKTLSERDICTKFITPAIMNVGWKLDYHFREEITFNTFTDGKIEFKGKLTYRGIKKRADYILYYKPNIPIAIIEAKDNNHSVRAGIQQALEYARILDIPCVFSSNGDGFLFHDRTAIDENIETEIALEDFPTPEQLWEKYKKFKGIATPAAEKIVEQDYFFDGSNRKPRYYQQIAINRTVEAIAKGQNKVLLVMATGTGKTYTAFQIIHRLWKSGAKKRILFLADRNALIDQTKRGDFKHFKDKMTVVKHREVNKAYEIYLALYQGLTGTDEAANIYKQFSKDFFDLIIIDECHRGSANEDSAWRSILEYFGNATQIGLTATPKETKEISNSDYFGEPLFTYTLKQGIADGYLAPYKVTKVLLDVDLEGWKPRGGQTDENGELIEDREYNQKDFDRNLVLKNRTILVAQRVVEYLETNDDPYAKTIVFCEDIDHAERMRQAIVNANPQRVKEDSRYVMRITGDSPEGKAELGNFTDPNERYPVIATTSQLMTTGVDAKTCKLIVLDKNIQSPTEFKQIIGRGTRVDEEHGKTWFMIMDFRNATKHFDMDFDAPPLVIYEATAEDPIQPPTDDADDGEIVETPTEPRKKYVVSGGDIQIFKEQVQYLDHQGKLITENFKDYSRRKVEQVYASLEDFLKRWEQQEQHQAILKELEEQGLVLEALQEAVGKEFDPFDLICHVAYGKPPLTRKERAENVKKRCYFSKYGEKAQRILEALLEKYADDPPQNLADVQLLRVNPFATMGTPVELIQAFGSKQAYQQAVYELESELYKDLG
jgi:type I restriction enzyme R subunit